MNAPEQAEELLATYKGSLSSLCGEEISRLRMAAGIGLKSAISLKVASEWGRRCSISADSEHQTISSSADVVEIFRSYFDSMKHEECWILYLSVSNRVVERYRVSKGGVTATVVDHRLIVKRALELLSTQIIMVHNHPSGAVEPSEEDIVITKKVKSAAALFDISLVDHLIISSNAYFSFRSKGLL